MRNLMMAAISATALCAAMPAVAQGYGGAIPAPGGMVYAAPPVYAGPPPGPQVPSAGPRVWQNGRWMSLPPSQNVARQHDPNRWGYDSHGRWEAGSRAPGGWGAYRRLGRGHRMPQYWLGGSFWINDYLNFGLAAPPQGYRWMRYYDDAVLVDHQGMVWDSVGGIAWAGAGAYSSGGHSSSYSYSSSGASIQPVDPNAYYGQQPYPGGYPPPVTYAPPAVEYGSGYGASYGSSYQQGSYYYGAPTSSTVVIIPTTTTTTVVEEIIEETVVTKSYVRAAPRRVVRRAPAPKKRYRAKPRPACCQCICR